MSVLSTAAAQLAAALRLEPENHRIQFVPRVDGDTLLVRLNDKHDGRW